MDYLCAAADNPSDSLFCAESGRGLMDNPHYCSAGWSFYHKLADTFMNFETNEQYSPEMFDEMEYDSRYAKLREHFQTCPQCSLEEARSEKKRPTPVR